MGLINLNYDRQAHRTGTGADLWPLDMNNYKVEKLPKMDNPVVPIDSVDGDVEYHHFRISMTRDGVLDIMKID